MILTNCIITSVRAASPRATGCRGPPDACTAKPSSTENTISGSMALRLRSPTKSLAVKKLTIMSDMDAYSPISSQGMAVQGTSTGGKSFISTNMITAAMAPVTTNTATVVPMILPARCRLSILAMDPAMDTNTRGTTTQNIMLMNTVPRGLMALARSGKNHPATQPKAMAPSIIARKR